MNLTIPSILSNHVESADIHLTISILYILKFLEVIFRSFGCII